MTAQRRHLQHQAVQHIYQSGIVRVHRSGTGATGDKEEPVALLRMQRHYGGEQLTELLVSQRLHMAHHKGAAVTHQGGTVTRHQIFPAGAHEHGTVNLDERRVRKRPFGVEHLHHLGLGCARFTVNDKWAIALQILLQCQVGGGERLGNAIETVKESIYCLLAIRVGDAVFFQRDGQPTLFDCDDMAQSPFHLDRGALQSIMDAILFKAAAVGLGGALHNS